MHFGGRRQQPDQADRHRRLFFRRLRRIYPPLWILIAFSIAAFLIVDYTVIPGVLSDPPWPQRRPWWFSGWQWFGSLTLTETWRHYVVGTPRGIFPGQAWTLCYEEQFYALMGLLLLAPRWIFCGAVAITAFTLAMVVGSRLSGLPIEGFFFDGSWLMFAVGILVYYATNYGGTPARWISSVTCLAAAAGADAIPVPGTRAAFVFALAILWLRPFDRALSTARWARPFMYCGKICYSLYLTQQLPIKAVSTLLARAGVASAPGTLFVTVPLCVAAAVVAGSVFHQFVERHFLNAPATANRLAAAPAIGSQLSDAPRR